MGFSQVNKEKDQQLSRKGGKVNRQFTGKEI